MSDKHAQGTGPFFGEKSCSADNAQSENMDLSPSSRDELWGLSDGLCNGTLTGDQRDRLEAWIAADPQAREFCALQLHLHAMLRWRYRPLTPAVAAEVPVPPVGRTGHALPLGVLGDAWRGAAGYLSNHEFFTGYVVATVLFAVAALVASHVYVTERQGQAEFVQKHGAPSAPQIVKQTPGPEIVLIGQITGMVDCRWVNADDAPFRNKIKLHDKFALTSGLMEITYYTGARVILQGPCTYEVESAEGGYLSLGKLTARVEKKTDSSRLAAAPTRRDMMESVEGDSRREGAAAKQSSPFLLPPSPLFSVRTPTALVTDLGTEFGVEVDKAGATWSHVYRGKVEVRTAGGSGKNDQVVALGANESARIDSGKIEVVENRGSKAAEPSAFVREMPRRTPMKLFNTGAGLREGDTDPHWQLIARSDDPKFKPTQAVATSISTNIWRPNDKRSQWLSTGAELPEVPNRVVYTFRTKFRLDNMASSKAILQGQFIADNHMEAIRLNGRPVRVPEHGYQHPFDLFIQFTATEGFVEGDNTLELDVYNGDAPNPKKVSTISSPVLLRVELEGAYLSSISSNNDGRNKAAE